ncbi:MAG: 1-deoxy-D-xylulose-5-phosphate reductoisomerase [Desulfococcus sp. 4484_241]|nr:MAG: 1-deoxy-D-xylulose-5-phosphate reductoisomerase [Desulfococcus sp. 4484_241]
MKRLSILGSTGSIGVSTLDVVSRFPDHFCVEALCAKTSIERLARQVARFSPRLVAVIDKDRAMALKDLLPSGSDVEIVYGEDGYCRAASMGSVDMVVSAMVGAAGLSPTLSAIHAGKAVALANKEVLVMAGAVVMRLAAEKKVPILPIDSEHSAIFQCLEGNSRDYLSKIHLTASGGPFLHRKHGEVENVTPEQALSHPTWDMGPKISIDSATLMNKGLEVIEASFLFDVPVERIEVVIHPQSIIHSMVSYIDGSMLAQLAVPDMKGAISYALAYPERLNLEQDAPDLARLGELTFFSPDLDEFPCLRLALDACRKGGTFPAALNAANEVAVNAFLDRKISFGRIPRVIESVLEMHTGVAEPVLSDIRDADAWARARACELVGSCSGF